MPELPETETIANDLHSLIVDACIESASVHRADVLREIHESALGVAVANHRIAKVWRRAKLIVFDLCSGGDAPNDEVSSHVVVQPRFTGALLIDDGTLSSELREYLTVTFALSDGRSLHYRDVRRLGTLAVMSPQRFKVYSAKLGPEPLDAEFTVDSFSALVRSTRRPIKMLLMDQAKLAGVGNIYANEALWHAGVDPSRSAETLSLQQSAQLLEQLQVVLRASIAARGTSFRDYRDARGARGGFVPQLAAYGRGGQPCLRCGRKLVETHAIDGRTSVLCAYCQR